MSLPSGAYRDPKTREVRAFAYIGKAGTPAFRRTSARFPATATDDEIASWQIDARATLAAARDRDGGPSRTGGLAADVAVVRLLKPESHDPGEHNRRAEFDSLMKHWIDEFPDRGRDQITRLEIRQTLTRWKDANVAPTTRNHRLAALAFLYASLDDDEDAIHPTDKIKRAKPRPAEPRSLPVWFADRVVEGMPDYGRGDRFGTRPAVSLTKTRLRVMLWTGLSRMALIRMQPGDVRPEGRRGDGEPALYLRPRKKGDGVEGRWIPATARGLAALETFGRLGLWGKSFSASSVRKSLRGAIDRELRAILTAAEQTGDLREVDELRLCLPVNIRPYDFRHTFIDAVMETGGDLPAAADVAHHAGGDDFGMTKRYAARAIRKQSRQAIAAFDKAYPVRPAPPVPRARGALKLVDGKAPA